MATRLTAQEIAEVARKSAADIARGGGGAAGSQPAGYSPSPSPAYGSDLGVFTTVNEAVAAAKVAQVAFAALRLEQRAKIIEAIRATMRENGSALAKAAHEETGFGRYEDKVMKNTLVTDASRDLKIWRRPPSPAATDSRAPRPRPSASTEPTSPATIPRR